MYVLNTIKFELTPYAMVRARRVHIIHTYILRATPKQAHDGGQAGLLWYEKTMASLRGPEFYRTAVHG